jgi:uncharacterized protein YegP (UPF0339 family)
MIRNISALVAIVALSLSTVACASNENEADSTAAAAQDISASAVSNGKFELFTGTDGDIYFRFVASNGQKLLQSEAYTTKASAEKGVDSVVANAPDTHNVHVLESTSSQFYFVVDGDNGEVIATSQMYASKSDAQRGALTVRQLTRVIADQT